MVKAKPKTKPTSPARPASKSARAARAIPAAASSKVAPSAAVEPINPLDEKKPDAPAGTVVTHARALANQVRTDATELARAKVSPADADRLATLADALDTAQTAWTTAKDAQGQGAVAKRRAPLRAGRDHLFEALRTFADTSETTQRALDDIAGVEGDDDLATDTSRLLILADKHRRDLDGTDMTPGFLAELRQKLAAFQAARSGKRGEEEGDPTTSQTESEAMRQARRARNRAFWELATLSRHVCRRGQYAFRHDKNKRANYTLYRTSSAPGPDAPVDPPAAGPAKDEKAPKG
jgi:hypothetical protein